MTRKIKKIIKITLIVLTVLIVGGFVLNWYLAYRLESKLNKILSEEVSKATNGFYNFSFEELSIGLFSGELSIRGIEMIPDTLTFNKWKQADSLPQTYFNIHVGEIHFKGINLVWRRDYKKLNFKLFEIKDPDIEIYAPITSDTLDNQQAKNEAKTLYGVVSPYIDVLTVRDMNLTNASVAYYIDDIDSPVTYALGNANFHASGFRLDKDSNTSGKLLYCDNFEFIAKRHQELLYSDQLILDIDSIKLSTIDSVIQINGVQLSPKDSVWENRLQYTGEYLKSQIKSVMVDGVYFERKSALNYLNARSFDISSTDIQYHSVKGNEKNDAGPVNTDSIEVTWSLYEILSPLLHSISIGKIGIEKTKFDYTITQEGKTDVYSLKQFDFHANRFLVDPQSEKHKKFWYVDNFALIGAGISGTLESKNSEVDISKLSLSTMDSSFVISDISIKPMSEKVKEDYIKGKIKSIEITGLSYDTGISAEELKIESPDIDYFKVAGKVRPAKSGNTSPGDVFDMLYPYASYLSVKNIDLKNATITFYDKRTDGVFHLNRLNFYASDFLINGHTRATSRYFFTYKDIGFSFRDFDNILPGKEFRLQVKKGEASTLSGKLELQDVKLIPQTDTWSKAPDTYYLADIPSVIVTGFDNEAYMDDKKLEIGLFSIESPHIEVVKVRNSSAKNSEQNASSLFDALRTDNIKITNLNVRYLDKTSGDSLKTRFKLLDIRNLGWGAKESFSIGELTLSSPEVIYHTLAKASSESSKKEGLPDFLKKNMNIKKLTVTDSHFMVTRPEMNIEIKNDLFNLSSFIWNDKFSLASLNVHNPSIDINEQIGYSKPPKAESSGDLYSLINTYTEQASVGEIEISNANINYSHSINGKKQDHQAMNTTNLFVKGLSVDAAGKKIDMEDFKFRTNNLGFPVMDGYYTLKIGDIDLDKKERILEMSGIHLIPAYSKMDFAYKHPLHKDWFDVSVGDVRLSGIDYPKYFSDNMIKAKNLEVKDIMLQNFKNKQIYTPPKKQPLIYELLQRLPVKVAIDTASTSNFSVIYEELAKKGSVLGKISFMEMNGRFSGLTNIVSYPTQFIRLDVDGKLMGTGPFTARWDMPVSPDYDCFVLETHLQNFDLKDLNQIISPLAPAEIRSGMLKDMRFRTEASTIEARADMLFLYNGLEVNVFKNMEQDSYNKLFTSLANRIIKKDNPKKVKDKPREANISITRDPYHSNFNYFWQILQPATVESVGVSQGKQNFIKKVSGFFTKVKNFFTGKKEDKKEPNKK